MGGSGYAAAKGGIVSLTGVTAAEGKEHGITYNAISPLARTAMSAEFFKDDADPALDPVTVAPLVVFLAADASPAITGETFRVARNEISVVRTTIGAPIRCNGGRWTADEIASRVGEIVR